ncbi:hypothetical protein WJX81_005532 [Elliptochloris bilobata]|uniref:Response regulatory domain-containing protein n=1 Tax=Elliptochloris bilobata TaxID=381761 RepID=A0AAW1QHT4_9CHLO
MSAAAVETGPGQGPHALPPGRDPVEPCHIHVLLVDDERLSRIVVGGLLRKCQYRVTEAGSGLEALEMLRKNEPGTFSLILTDVMMPDVDGVELLRHVRGDDSLNSMPVVMMSANEHTETVFECIRGGAEDYLLKPVTRKEVQHMWQHVWRRQQSAQRVPHLGAEEGDDLLDAQAVASAPVPSASAALVQASAAALQPPLPEGESNALTAADGAAAATVASVAAVVDEARRASGAQAGPSPRIAGGEGCPEGGTAETSEGGNAAGTAPGGGAMTVAAIGPTISLAAYFARRREAVSAPDAFRIFCGVLAMLQPLHMRGLALRRVRPSLLRLTAGGAVVAAAAAAAEGEDALYASPEELLSSRAAVTPKSDVYSLGVLFFELFNPVTDPAARAHVLGGLRHRILPNSLLQARPTEAAFCQALLHPDPAARPAVAAIARSQLLAALHRSICAGASPAGARPAEKDGAEERADAEVLLDFLRLMRRSKVVEGDRCLQQLRVLEADIGAVQAQLEGLAREPPEELPEALLRAMAAQDIDADAGGRQLPQPKRRRTSAEGAPPGAPAPAAAAPASEAPQLVAGGSAARAAVGEHLAAFSDDLSKFSLHTRLKVTATLRFGDVLQAADMVCSTAFDRDDEFFATAGVSRRIKVYARADVEAAAAMHVPRVEMGSRAKLSCVAWNSYVKGALLAADYDGGVALWDAEAAACTALFEEHSKRVWSVDFSQADPTRFLSGSDDCTVRLWSLHDPSAAAVIDAKANVCSVQFSPSSSHLIAFGSANYRVYIYDLRTLKVPLVQICGHSRAVSYVRWMGPDRLVSASTDNRLKLWDVAAATRAGTAPAPLTTFTGHVNERNFVGLSVTADGYLACGSEDNAVYAYHAGLPAPLAHHRFAAADAALGADTDAADAHHFVSSVCWSRSGHVLVAANSLGTVKLLQLA